VNDLGTRRGTTGGIARTGGVARHRTLTMRRPPQPAGPLANALTFVWRALLKIKHTPEQLFDIIATPVMLTVMFTYLFGGALAGSPEAYLQFLLPGILVQTVLCTTIYSGFTLNTDISKGIFDRFHSMPIWKLSPIVGAMAGDMIRYTAYALIVIVIGLIMGFRPEAGVVGVVLAIALLDLFAFGVGWIITVLALLARTSAAMLSFSSLVMMLLTFVSNAYVDPATMPGWLQAFVHVNPVSHLVTAVRSLMAGAPDFCAISLVLAGTALCTAICAPLAMRLYHRRI
jgi:ABC-2 type transport system permease protein